MDRKTLISTGDIQPIVNERIGQFLSSTPPVVEQVFRNLNIKDLCRCARVCKLWSQIAEVVKKERHGILWMFQEVPLTPEEEDIMDDSDDDDDDIDFLGTCCEFPWSIGKRFYHMMKNSFIQPETGIIFVSTELFTDIEKYFKGFTVSEGEEDSTICNTVCQRLYYEKPLMQFLSKKLPKNCRIICCGAIGVFGPPVGSSDQSEEEDTMLGFTSCMFSNIPGVQIHQFSLPDDEFGDDRHNKFDGSKIAELTGIPESTNIKALILFCVEEGPETCDVTRSIVDHYMKKQDFKIAFGGAVVNTVESAMQNKDKWTTKSGLAFTGDNVNAASFVIQSSIDTEEEYKIKLMEFKSRVKISNTSIAFMFVSFAKGFNDSDEIYDEPSAFREVFPNTLLFGCYTNGELGIPYLPNVDPKLEKKLTFDSKHQRMPNWTFIQTTVFVIISW